MKKRTFRVICTLSATFGAGIAFQAMSCVPTLTPGPGTHHVLNTYPVGGSSGARIVDGPGEEILRTSCASNN